MSVAQRHVFALDALLRVGQRSARRLAAEATLPPKVGVVEIVAQGATVLADHRADVLLEAQPLIAAAAEDEAAVERLQAAVAHVESLKADPDGPYRADRLWLGTLVSLVLLALVLALGLMLVAEGLRPGPLESILLLALVGVVAAAAGDWSGRARDRRLIAAALASLIALALGAALVASSTWERRSQNYAIEVLTIVACGCAGYLMGRARHVAPRIREADRVRRLEHELLLANEQARRSASELDVFERRYAVAVDQVGGRVFRTVEEYLKAIEDIRVTSGVFDDASAAELRRLAADEVAGWDRTLR